jgi:carboxymethylenebutenolidase
MFADITKPPPPLPTANASPVCAGVTLQTPLSRRGHGPGIILLIPDSQDLLAISEVVPSPVIKWSEEGYSVVAIEASTVVNAATDGAQSVLRAAVAALRSCIVCEPKDNIGLVGV